MTNIEDRGSNGITLIPMDSRLMTDRKVFIKGEINSEAACEFLKKIMYLNSESTSRPIDVLINSEGGEINSGMLMYDVIQDSIAPVRTFCIGRAYSMGAVLFACGNHGRYMLPHSELMIHEPLISNRVGGSASSMKSISDNLMETRKKMNQLLAKHTGKSEAEVEEATGYDHYLSPEESIEFGLADEIVGFSKIMDFSKITED